jgi:molybdate transport system substrate-binding protein
MMKYAFAMSVTAMMLFLACGVKGNSDVLLVFAATSLTDAMGDVYEEFEANDGVDVLFSFGGSQSLAKQIASGAPADMYISSGAGPVEFLQDEGIPLAESINLLANRLVVVSRRTVTRPESLTDLSGTRFNRIAIADPGMSPAGAYAREALVVLDLWDALEPKITYGSDVRATLTYVETGNADAGVVYATDARLTDLVISDIVPREIYLSIVYPAVILDESSNKHLARDFLDFLRSRVANEIFIKHGFGMTDR